MAINTTNGNEVKFLGLSATIREALLNAILGNTTDGKATVNTALKCYIGLSSTNPETAVTEPPDANYQRVLLGKRTSGSTWTSDYLTITGASAVNEGIKNEIKFNRSLSAWDVAYPYFILCDSDIGGNVMAWGALKEPITVDAKNVVPLFEENKFRLYFPAPSEVEEIVDNAAEADAAQA